LTASPTGRPEDTLTGGAGQAGGQTLTAKSRAAETTLTRAGGDTGDLTDKVDWEIGDVIDGKYEIRAELGRGGMGMVYKVHHRDWDIDMAVKMPLANLVADEASKARFIREAQTWVELGLHPTSSSAGMCASWVGYRASSWTSSLAAASRIGSSRARSSPATGARSSIW